ncbi:hypothetical protein AMJ85_11115 [candidate division BRC1 bacterium SM23_51]|nr:MAG: hypothetical protein AMJ85_11115 [candidate division BRC1 bacterium SM23_51]
MNELALLPGQPMRVYQVPELNEDDWIVQIKKNGRRCIVRCAGDDTPVELFNRHGERLTNTQDWQWLSEVIPPPFVLDGEELGSRQAGAERNRLVLWDCILLDGETLLDHWYTRRLVILRHRINHSGLRPVTGSFDQIAALGFLGCWRRDVWQRNGQYFGILGDLPLSDWPVFWELITDPDGPDEGLVFKRATVALAWHPRPGVKDPNQLKLRRKG